MKDYYKILGLHKNCSSKEIKISYRKLAQEWHPDRNKSINAHEKFIEIHEAYEFLNNPQKRKLYDQMFAENLNTVPLNKPKYYKEKGRYEEYRTKAQKKAKEFSKMAFEKFFNDFLKGIKIAGKGIEFSFSLFMAIFFICVGCYGLFIYIKALGDWNGEWWRLVLGTILGIGLPFLFIVIGYRGIKSLLD